MTDAGPTPSGAGEPTARGWQSALAFALVGRVIPVRERPQPDAVALLDDLDGLGWPVARIADHARGVHAAEQPWPHPVPTALRAGLGFAQLHAALARVREALGLTVLEVRPPSARTSLDADERRLLADVPPHHVAL